MNRSMVAVVAFLLVAPVVFSQGSFDVDVRPIDNRIYPNETASFKVTYSNNVNIIENFQISSPDQIYWDVYTAPRNDYVVEVFPNKEKTIDVFFKPLYIEPGIYNVRLNVEAQRLKQRITEELEIEVRNPTPGYKHYTPSIDVELQLKDVIDPRDPFTVNMILRNLVPVELDNLRVRLESGLFTENMVVDLEPLGTKILNFTVNLPDKTPPQKNALSGEILYIDDQNKSYFFKIPREVFTIEEYTYFLITPVVDTSFLKAEYALTVANDGNVPSMKVVTEKARFLDSLFAKTVPEATKQRTSEGTFYAWNVVLGPQETTQVYLTRNYIPLLVAILIIAGIVLWYFLARSPVLLYKTATKTKGNEDGFNQIKITMHLRNRSSKPIDEIQLVDRIPHMIEVEKNFRMGTIKPDKIVKRHGKTTKIIWKIPSLEAFEERIVTYKLSSKLSIVGGLTLPAGYVRFMRPNGKKRLYLSNRYVLGGV